MFKVKRQMTPRLRTVGVSAIALAMALGAAACSGSDGGGNTPGVTDDVIRVGEITAGTGPAAVFGNGITNGQRAYFEKVNADGGIDGRKIELVVEDSQYDVQKSVSAYAKIADDVAVMGQIIGTPHTNAVMKEIDKDNLLVAPSSSAVSLTSNPHMILVSTPYAIDWINVAAYAVDELDLGDVPWGSISPDDDFGVDHRLGAKAAQEAYDLDITEVTYRPGDTDFTAQIQRLKDAGAEAVLLGSIGGATTQILGAAKQLNYNPTWLASNPAWVSAFGGVPEANELFTGAKIYMASPFAVWGSDDPGMAEMLAAHDEFTPDQPAEIYFMMGYAQAKVIHAILEKASDLGDLSREGLVEAYNQVGVVEQGGLLPDLDYDDAGGIPTREDRIFTFDADTPGFLKAATDLAASETAADFSPAKD